MKLAYVVALLWLAAAPVRPGTTTVIPWAWERAEDLRFLEPGATVAWYAGIVTLDGERVRVEPRRNPLLLAKNAHRVAVIRIETKRPRLDDAQLQATLAAIRRLYRNAEELQIDFDATRSERAFYRSLLIALRRDLDAPCHPERSEGPGRVGLEARACRPARPGPSLDARDDRVRLSITALASWCLGDRWLHDLPIDEAVPMLFRMGRDEREIRARLARHETFPEPRCRTSVGLSLDEPLPRIPHAARIWIFHPERWTEAEWNDALSRVR